MLNPFQRRDKVLEKRRPGSRGRDAPRRAGEQLQPQPLFQATHGMAQSGLRHAQPGSGAREAPLLGDRSEYGKVT